MVKLDGCCRIIQGPRGPIGPVGPQGIPGPVGPQGIPGPVGPAFASTYLQFRTIDGAGSTNVGAPIQWAPVGSGASQTELSNGITIGGTGNTTLTFTNIGVYRVHYELPLSSTSGIDIGVVPVLNGTDLPYGLSSEPTGVNQYMGTTFLFQTNTIGSTLEFFVRGAGQGPLVTSARVNGFITNYLLDVFQIA